MGAKSTALTVPAPPREGAKPKPGRMDIRRWVMATVSGMSTAEIATRTGVSPQIAQASIDRVKEYRGFYSNDLLQSRLIEVAMDQLGNVGKVWNRGMKATKRDNKSQRMVADVLVQLKTVDSVRSFVETVQPKGPGIQLNQQFNNGGGGNGHGTGTGMSFEARLREQRAKRGLTNTEGVTDRTTDDASDGQTLEEELEGIGVDLDDAEDEDEGDDDEA